MPLDEGVGVVGDLDTVHALVQAAEAGARTRHVAALDAVVAHVLAAVGLLVLVVGLGDGEGQVCLLYTSPSPRDLH